MYISVSCTGHFKSFTSYKQKVGPFLTLPLYCWLSIIFFRFVCLNRFFCLRRIFFQEDNRYKRIGAYQHLVACNVYP